MKLTKAIVAVAWDFSSFSPPRFAREEPLQTLFFSFIRVEGSLYKTLAGENEIEFI
jgi:hypothetical protein